MRTRQTGDKPLSQRTIQKRRASGRLRYWYPTAPLMARFPEEMSLETIAQVLGVTRATVVRFGHPNHRIRWSDADKLAIRLGVHPMNIWGDTWMEEQDPYTRIR